MAVDGVGATGSTSSVASASSGGASSMTPEDFYKILIAELQYQDPSQPMDNAQMVQQVANIQSIQASSTMTTALQSVTRQQNFGTAAAMIGKKVTGEVQDAGGDKQTVQGVVTSVTFESNGKAVLQLDTGTKLPLEAVVAVQNAPAASSSSGSSSTNNTNGTSSTNGSGAKLQSIMQMLGSNQKAA